MKKIVILFIGLLTAFSVTAQTKTNIPAAIHLKNGTTVTFNENQIDSTRYIFTPEGDSLGLKVYVKGQESTDFLHSQISYIDFYTISPSANVNKNNTADLVKNPEGWRLEFPRMYQGNDLTFEVTHSTANYGITYSLEWDGSKKANRWTCYEMYAGNMAQNVKRMDDFREDSVIPAAYRTTLTDYSGSGYSRGHLCPSADRLCSQEQNGQTFLLSNMQPQIQEHNGGVWGDLENKVRTYADKCDTLYIVKAATIDNDANILTHTTSGLIVPSYFYMALMMYTKATNTYQTIGVWSPHAANSTTEYISIDELEKRTGIDFFCNLPDDIEATVESTFDKSRW